MPLCFFSRKELQEQFFFLIISPLIRFYDEYKENVCKTLGGIVMEFVIQDIEIVCMILVW